jgi:hypothetical protein
MAIRMLASVCDTAFRVYEAGETYDDIDGDVAKQWIAAGLAESAPSRSGGIERATVQPPEAATAKPQRKARG